MRFPFKLTLQDRHVRSVVSRALQEDIGKGDVTTDLVTDSGARVRALLRLKQDGVIAGLPVFECVFKVFDPEVLVRPRTKEGKLCRKGTVLAEVCGKVRSIFACERVALNFIQHLSGIATVTHRFAERVKGTRAKIVDTRKTIPGLRQLEKYAVVVGGGYNHRPTLFDLILIKDNHITAAGGIRQAVERARATRRDVLVELEVGPEADLDDLRELEIDMVMLDNWPMRRLERAIGVLRGFPSRPLIEVSGRVRLDNVRRIAMCGPDFISIGYLTHSATSLDISLDLEGRAKT